MYLLLFCAEVLLHPHGPKGLYRRLLWNPEDTQLMENSGITRCLAFCRCFLPLQC